VLILAVEIYWWDRAIGKILNVMSLCGVLRVLACYGGGECKKRVQNLKHICGSTW